MKALLWKVVWSLVEQRCPLESGQPRASSSEKKAGELCPISAVLSPGLDSFL